MPPLRGVHLLPSTGEFTYDTVAYVARRVTEVALEPINTFYGAAPTTDYSIAIEQLAAAHPECETVSLVVSWFCDGLTAGSCNVFPSTTYIGGAFQRTDGSADPWRCSGLTQASAGLVPIPTSGSSFVYGGTPSDQSIVRCLRDLKSRGYKVVFYPFLLMTASGLPWRGSIGYSPDGSSASTSAINAFLGPAQVSDFTPDGVDLTVAYAGSSTDWTYRRMILHYASLVTLAGGVNLFVIGSELRGLETVRGPGWTKAGSPDGLGHAVWDYPFVAGLKQLAADVRSIFDSATLPKDISALENLVTYSADWSDWMGFQHAGENGQWPHLDHLWAAPDIDVVSFDNYLPLSDWTTTNGGLDAMNWQSPLPGAWPTPTPASRGFALSGAPTLCASAYLQANIEGGEKFDWYYRDGTNDGPGLDPNGSCLVVSLPQGDRASQSRNAYFAGQQLLANKQMRWWWNNPHFALYDTGSGWVAQGMQTEWGPNAKPIVFLEYGIPSCDKGTNQPNVFFSATSSQSATPYWSEWIGDSANGYAPRRDDTISVLGLTAIYEYWLAGANNENVGGVPMIEPALCCAWNWDARPFPVFPLESSAWGDAADWQTGNWLNGRGPPTAPIVASPDPAAGTYPTFPTLTTESWSTHIRPRFATDLADHVSGRSTRRARAAFPLYNIELTYDVLRADDLYGELQEVVGFYEARSGAAEPFWIAPPGLADVVAQPLGVGDGNALAFALRRSLGGFVEPVAAASTLSAVYLDGVAQSNGWSVTPGYAPSVVFAVAPPSGVAISADFGAMWLVRFSQDIADLENFAALLWAFKTVKLQTVRP